MSSQSTAAGDYTYQRPSTTATRAIITGTKPQTQPSASSTDMDVHTKPTLEQPKTTDNYARAAAEASKAGTAPSAVAPASSSGDNDAGSTPAAASVDDGNVARPGMTRQQSWQMRDLKGEHQGNMLGGVTTGHGYSSTGK